jgi:ubiquinone/menaquinone biosynthesis C-methylase UbiE
MRNVLIDEYYGSQEIFYRDHYKSVIFGKGFGPKMVRRTHEAMEKPFRNKSFDSVLEIGGGTGEHLEFILHSYKKYFLTDLKKPILDSNLVPNPKVVCLQANAEALPSPAHSFDRVIATCLLHHVEKPEQVLSEILRVLKPEGSATIFLSCDPGALVRVIRSFTTAHNVKKEGFSGYKLMVARDHRNHVGSLLHMERFIFRYRKQKISYFPFKFIHGT